MEEYFKKFVIEPFDKFTDRLLVFLPNLLLAMLLMAGGLVVAAAVRLVIHRALEFIGLDRHASRWGVTAAMRRWGGGGSLSGLAGRLFFWLVVIMFAIIALNTLNVAEVNLLLQRFFLYLPNLFIALVILVAGFVFSNFAARAALVWAVNSGLGFATLISRGAQALVVLLAITMAMEQLGISPMAILVVFSILFGGLVLGLAIAFGIGGKDLAKEFLERRFRESKEKNGIEHL